MSAQHTPGPWTIEKCPCGHKSCKKHFISSGHFFQGTGFALPDALLIAAAPEMLKALEKAQTYIFDEAERRNFDPPIPAELVVDISAAIAKARGAA